MLNKPPKGRASFTVAKAAKIKRLLTEKVLQLGRDKNLNRGKLRRLDFHIRDFWDGDEFTTAHFDQLVHEKNIRVTG